MDAFSLVVFVLAWVFALLYLPKILKSRRNPLKLPPGPKPWPIIGNFDLLGPLPHQSLHQLSLKYGKTMQLQFGSYPVFVTSSLDIAKQILKTYDHMFASRPQTAAGKYTTYEYSDLAWAPYGPYWRQGRKIYLTELFSAKRLESYEYMRIEEMREFTRRLYRNCGKTIELKDYLSHYTLSIISRIVLGKKYFSASESEKEIVTLEEFQEMLDELFLLNGVLNIGDWIPWLDFLDLQGYVKRMKKLKVRFDRFHDHVIDEHNAKRKATKNWQPKDMVDLLLQLADDPELEDLIAGGTDTAATMGDWSMSELLKKPQLFKRMILVSLANMLHGFTWELPPGMKPEDVKRDEVFGLATQRKYPTVAVAKPRLPLHLYN
ncbi:hypothetical protein POTOM_025573 [Populus tomentosa]|uniref:Flavonoid 3'-monooxygenase-like n=1 Tax=Populus tomentosa TaxID=118781 RepID=A0A8X7ZI87_POPTO|nr:hypothetical protein POTOM_025573 [Populus tomentosa]